MYTTSWRLPGPQSELGSEPASVLAFDPSVKHHAPAFPVGQADRFCIVLISADAGPNAGNYANTLAGHQSEVRLIRPVAPPEIDSLVWLRAERRFRVVWRGFPRARATLEPAENLMPSGCAPRPFAYFPSLTAWCGQAGLHSCYAARADGGWSARPARRRDRPQEEGPAQAAHAAEGEEEVGALSKFMCARHACGAAGKAPPVQRAQRATAKALHKKYTNRDSEPASESAGRVGASAAGA